MPSEEVDHATVPLVMYVGEERHVIGEATITNGQVKSVLKDTGLADRVMDMIIEQPSRSRFVFSFDADYVNEVKARYEPQDAILKPIYKEKPNAE